MSLDECIPLYPLLVKTETISISPEVSLSSFCSQWPQVAADLLAVTME